MRATRAKKAYRFRFAQPDSLRSRAGRHNQRRSHSGRDLLSPARDEGEPPVVNLAKNKLVCHTELGIVREKSVGNLLRGTRPSGAMHKRFRTLFYRSLLGGHLKSYRAAASPRTKGLPSGVPIRPSAALGAGVLPVSVW